MVEPAEYAPVTEDGGVTKRVLMPGYGEDRPQKGQQIIVLFTVYRQDGSVVQSVSDPMKPVVFFFDSEALFKGLRLAAQSMRRGEVARFRLKPEYGPEEGEKRPMEVEVEMVDFHEKWKHMIDLEEKDRLEFARKLKDWGNEHFKAGRTKPAAYHYSLGIEYVETLVDMEDYRKTPKEVLELRRSLLLNLSIVANALQSWHNTVKYCSVVIEKEAENSKARYLRGLAYSKIGRFEDALTDLRISHKQTPDDTRVVALIQEIKEFETKQKGAEKKRFQKIFQSESIYKEISPKVTSSLAKFPPYDPTNPRVFLEIQVGSRDPKRLVFELIKSKVPKTVENFRVFCTGEKVHPYRPYTYKDSYFHRVVKNFMIQGGDMEKRDGTGGYSIYGDKFDDENFFLPHSQAGILSMANHGPNTNGCQFFITFKKAPWCNGKNVAFGRLIQGFDFLLNELQQVETMKEFQLPKLPIKIINCGEYKEDVAPELPPKKKKPVTNETVKA